MNEDLIKLLPISTDRLVLKKTSINDIDLILKMDKQEITQKYLGGIKNKTKEERLEFLKKKENSNSLTVYLGNIQIGFIGIKSNTTEVSYIFDSDYTGKGYCTEALGKLIEVYFYKLNFDKLSAECIIENIASRRVLEKNNFIVIDENEKYIYYELKKEV